MKAPGFSSKRGRHSSAGLLVCLTSLPLCLCSFSSVAAQNTNLPARTEYRRYEIIPERNIFNTRRYARTASAPVERRDTRRATRVDYVALVGTMRYEKGPFAFFDGSTESYRKALKPQEEIAGFKVASIGPNQVLLQAGTNQFELRVGKQLRREDRGAWRVADYESTRVAWGATGSSSSSSSDSRYSRDSRDSRDQRDGQRSDTAEPARENFVPPMPEGGFPPPIVIFGGEGQPGEQAAEALPQPGAEGERQGATPPPADEAQANPDAARDNAPPAGGEEPMDEVTRRLIERREQQLNR